MQLLCFPRGSVLATLPVVSNIVAPLQGIEKMRAAGQVAAKVLAHAGSLVRPGITTEELDRAVHEMTIEAGAYPSPLRYGKPPFPKSVCTSVNECVCHGVPDMRPLQDGDIVNIDVTVYLDGYHGDTSR
jgi:methionyl aminopeptidase